eukprot:TRINITY_DN4772_c0_g1_i1.p1 TRINITY_DN4772_c0_g1~~TRINITY_DN4772_c0_g1_i1.p1  ORF type:complete len:561 (+),score=178.90 TRINITY_DN4772_c0_g1_i1:376-2058(+)
MSKKANKDAMDVDDNTNKSKDSKSTKDSKEKKTETPAPPKPFSASDIQDEINEITKAVNTQNTLPISRVLRKFFTAERRKINRSILTTVVQNNFPTNSELRGQILAAISQLPESQSSLPQRITSILAAGSKFLFGDESESASQDKMQTDEAPAATTPAADSTSSSSSSAPAPAPAPVTPPAEILPEVQLYLGLITLVALIDATVPSTEFATLLVSTLNNFTRRTLNPLTAKLYFYYSRSYEVVGRLAEIRSTLLSAQRTASLTHDEETHITVLNLLLRNYLHYNLYDQADKLQAKTTLKEDSISSNQLARFRYYQGRIKGIQLDYSGAYACLQEALTKSPQGLARGFRTTVTKFACIVQLLIGEIPERSIFRMRGAKQQLTPYLGISQAVRNGDLTQFLAVVKEFEQVFRKDKTYILIQRLRHNVIKTGLRKINISYSKISLSDVCEKLRLDGGEVDAEFIVAKAIRDGVIEATVDHEHRWMRSKENVDVYVTGEPLDNFTERVRYCLKMHNEAVKAMRYNPETTVKKKNDEDDEEREERKKQEQEIADKLSEVDEDDEI